MAKSLKDYVNITAGSGKAYSQLITKSDNRKVWEAETAEPFYAIQNGKWANSEDTSHGVNGWLHIDGSSSNWSVNQGNISNNNDNGSQDYGKFRSPSWNTEGLSNVRIKVISADGGGSVTVNGTNLANLLTLGVGTHEGTISGNTVYIDAGLDGGSWCNIDELYFY